MASAKKFKVIDPQGVRLFGRQLAVGDVVELEPGAHRDAWLRFGQIEEVKAAAEPAYSDQKSEVSGQPEETARPAKPAKAEKAAAKK